MTADLAVPTPPAVTRTTRLWWYAIVLLLATAVRLPGVFSDFAPDEIWSFNIARQLHGVGDLLLSDVARIDNNHPLNTLFMYLVGDNQPIWVYRLPALISGCLLPVLVIRAMRGRDPAMSIVAALLCAMSFPFVYYSTEARGYIPACLMAMLGLDAILQYARSPGWKPAAVFTLAAVVGFLWHLTFIHFFAAEVVFLAVIAHRRRESAAMRIEFWLVPNLLPLIFLGGLYVVFVRHLRIGGAAESDPMQVVLRSISMPFGAPASWAAPISVLVAFIFVLRVLNLVRDGDAIAYLDAVGVVIAPVGLVAFDLAFNKQRQPLMSRYFIVASLLLLLAMADAIARGWKSPLSRAVCSLLLAACLIGNMVWLIEFSRGGRGSYSTAVAMMFDRMPQPNVTVTTDDMPRTQRILDFYGPRLAPIGRSLILVRSPAEWCILTGRGANWTAPPRYSSDDGAEYVLVKAFVPDLTGTSWALYRVGVRQP